MHIDYIAPYLDIHYLNPVTWTRAAVSYSLPMNEFNTWIGGESKQYMYLSVTNLQYSYFL